MPHNIRLNSRFRMAQFRSRRFLMLSMAVALHTGMLFGPIPHAAHAQETTPTPRVASVASIYLYNSDNTLRDVTATYDTLGYVFDEAGNREDIILDGIHGEVFDWPDLRCVGYVVQSVTSPDL